MTPPVRNQKKTIQVLTHNHTQLEGHSNMGNIITNSKSSWYITKLLAFHLKCTIFHDHISKLVIIQELSLQT